MKDLNRLEFINKQLIDQNRELKETLIRLENESALARARYNEKLHFFEHALSRLSEMESGLIHNSKENAKSDKFSFTTKVV